MKPNRHQAAKKKDDDYKKTSSESYVGKKEEAPEFMKFNKYIQRGYRINHNIKGILRSLFSVHNQSINVWSHLVAAVLIFVVIFYFANIIDRHEQPGSLQGYVDELNNIWNQQKLERAEHYGNVSEILARPLTEEDLSFYKQYVSKCYLRYLERFGNQLQLLHLFTKSEDRPFKHNLAHLSSKIKTVTAEVSRIVIMLYNDTSKSLKQTNRRLLAIDLTLYEAATVINQKIRSLTKIYKSIPRWPILIFLVSAALCLSFSATFHLFYPLSQKSYVYFRRLDYAGVNLLIVGSTFPQMIYSTFCHPLIGYIYLAVIIVTGFTIFIILLCDWIHQPNHRKYKKYLFGGFGVSLIVPMMHALINEKLYGNFDDKFRFSGHVGYFLLLGACYLLGLLIYSVKCPERFAPGKFDLCGSSHQIWHVLVIIGIVITYIASLEVYKERFHCPCPS